MSQTDNASNYWFALTDGATAKFIRYGDGREQFFNLTSDPMERFDLGADPTFAPTLEIWRGRLAEQVSPCAHPTFRCSPCEGALREP